MSCETSASAAANCRLPTAPAGDILELLAARARARAEEQKARTPLVELEARAVALAAAERQAGGFFAYPFEAAIASAGFAFICECKRASPSKGLIAPEYDPVAIALDYEAAGASCISVLTEPEFFLGAAEHLRAVAAAVSQPCLRKDFVVDDWFIYEAKLLGAAAVLLIAAITPRGELERRIHLCRRLGLSALVEVHTERELDDALSSGASLIGINARNLRDFSVDLGVVERLAKLVPAGVPVVAESGVKSREDVLRLKSAGARAALIGETLMRAPDRRALLAELRSM
ncbi:MAG TPA: indole-3-glycerol phosphate synthase TrpC [Bacillota bacterium]|nr:indole-3-glycerol phosphate synthase TrpC [Bacillota bacterium]